MSIKNRVFSEKDIDNLYEKIENINNFLSKITYKTPTQKIKFKKKYEFNYKNRWKFIINYRNINYNKSFTIIRILFIKIFSFLTKHWLK